MRISIEGDSELREQILSIVRSNEDVTVVDAKGLTGTEVIQLILEYGPPAIVLLRQLVDLIEAANNVRKRWKITVDSDNK